MAISTLEKRVTEGVGGETLLLCNKLVPMLPDQGRSVNIQDIYQQCKFMISAVKLAGHRANILKQPQIHNISYIYKYEVLICTSLNESNR